MKKFLSFLLTFVMLFSLTMPAMAAEVTGTSNTNNPAENEVSATYNPDIYFTGIEVSSTFDLIDEGNGNYTAIVKPGEESANITFTFVGKNLDILPDDNTSLKIRYSPNGGSNYREYSAKEINILNCTFNYNFPDGMQCDFEYSNDGGETWTGGVHVDVKQGYSITNETSANANGTITVPEYAVEGQNVTVTVAPNDGYMLDELYGYFFVNDTLVELEFTGNTFTMPDANVTVKATFKVAPVTYNVTVNEAEGGTVTADKTTAAENDTVTLTVTPEEGYRLGKLTVTNVATSDVTDITDSKSFAMPAADVTVNATFVKEVKITGLSITVDGVTYDNTNTSAENPAVVYSDSTVTVTLYGINFDSLPEYADSENGFTVLGSNFFALDKNGTFWSIDTANNTATSNITNAELISFLAKATTASELKYTNDNWTTDLGSGVYVIYRPTHAITIDSSITNGTVAADKTAAREGQTVTLTVTPDAKYKLSTITVTRDDTGAEVEVNDKTFVMPASAVTVTATFEALPITSVEITWGSMSFTYDDTVAEGATEENGWDDNDTGWVTVKNTGETTFTAKAEYTSYDGYTSITGSFTPATQELAPASGEQAGEEYTFTLVLSGKPTKVLKGEKIGKVTITILESAEG